MNLVRGNCIIDGDDAIVKYSNQIFVMNVDYYNVTKQMGQ